MSEFKAPEGWMLVPIKPTQKMVNAAKEIDARLSVWKWADGYVEMLKAAPNVPEPKRQDCEPFGYFRPEPFGWTDCAPDDEGAIPLYAAPPKREPLSKLFAEAIVWGMVYGPEIHPAQWDSIRDEQAKAFADRSEVIGGQS